MKTDRQARFEKRANKDNFTAPKRVVEYVKECDEKNYFVSLLTKYAHYGIVEEIYGVKKIKAGTFIEKIACIPEDRSLTPVSRNCYFNYFGVFYVRFLNPKEKNNPQYEEMMYETSREVMDCCHRYELSTLDDIIALDGTLKYCAYVPNNGVIKAVDYIHLYRDYPIAEMVMKCKLPRLLKSKKCLEKLAGDKAFRGYIVKNADTLKGLAFQTIWSAYKRGIPAKAYAETRSLMASLTSGHCSSLSDITREIINKKSSYEKLHAYLIRQDLTSRVNCYDDYITACLYLKLDMADTKNLYPMDFWKYHDYYCDMYRQHLEEERLAKEALTSSGMKATAEKYSYFNYETKTLCIRVAVSCDDLVTESNVLGHCVSKCSYNTKQAEGRSLIIFVRKVGDVDTPYVTGEIELGEKNFKLLQLYGKKNCLPDEETRNFVNKWLATCNRKKHKLEKQAMVA